MGKAWMKHLSHDMDPKWTLGDGGGVPDYDMCAIQWNPSIMDTIGNQNFVRYREVSPAQGFPVYFR